MARLEARLAGQETGVGQKQAVTGEPATAHHEPPAVNLSTPSDADAPIGPGADEEAAYLATQSASENAPDLSTNRAEPPADKNLPPLETLLARIPAETHAALDELFRAKFTVVRRVPESAFKS